MQPLRVYSEHLRSETFSVADLGTSIHKRYMNKFDLSGDRESGWSSLVRRYPHRHRNHLLRLRSLRYTLPEEGFIVSHYVSVLIQRVVYRRDAENEIRH